MKISKEKQELILKLYDEYDTLKEISEKSMGWKENKIYHRLNIYSFEYCNKLASEYMNQIYEGANIYLDRKYIKYLQIKESCRSK